MGIIGVYILVFHWFDIYWIIAPNLHTEGAKFSWMDLTTFVGIGGLFLWFFWKKFSSNALVQVKEPRLEESINVAH